MPIAAFRIASFRVPTRAPAWGLAAAAALVSAHALGAPKGQNAEAQAAFREGKRLMAAHQYHRACPKLAESQQLSPSLNTLLQLALCHEQAGMYASAFTEFNDVTQQSTSGSDSAAKTARTHIDALIPKVSRLTIKLPPNVDVEGLKVMVDGHTMEKSAIGLPQPIDPGAHEITVAAPGRQRWTTRLSVGVEAEEKVIDVPVMARTDTTSSPVAAAEKEEALEKPTYGEPAQAAAKKKETPRSSRTALGNYLLGAGLVATGIGTYYGFQAISLRKDSNNNCNNGCTQKGVNYNEQAKEAAWIADIGIGVGVVGIVLGAYLSATSSDNKPKSDESVGRSLRVVPTVSATSSGLVMRGAW